MSLFSKELPGLGIFSLVCFILFLLLLIYLFLVWLSIGRTIFSLILVTLFNKIKEKEGGGGVASTEVGTLLRGSLCRAAPPGAGLGCCQARLGAELW